MMPTANFVHRQPTPLLFLPPITLISLGSPFSPIFNSTSLLRRFSSVSLRRKNYSRVSTKKSKNENTSKSSTGEVGWSEIGSSPDIIIVGAGVAGSALAYALAKDGRRVQVIERDLNEPDRIVGELLQPGDYLKLIELGLEDCVEEIDAQHVFGYAIIKNGKGTKLSYPRKGFQANVAGRSFHNGRFIQRMREKAASHPNVSLELGTVTSLVEKKGIIKGVLQNSKWSRVDSLCSSDHCMRWLFLKHAALSLQSKG